MIPSPRLLSLCMLAASLFAHAARADVGVFAPSADTYVRSDQPTTPQGSNALVLVGDTALPNSALRGLLSFDLASLPAGAVIRSASLRLVPETRDPASLDAQESLRLHALTEDFSEDAATWNERNPGTLWTWAGGSIDTTPLAEITASPATVSKDNPLVFESAALADHIANRKTPRVDLLVKLAVEDAVRGVFRFHSRASSASAPRLTLEYDRPAEAPADPGSATPVPGHPERPVSPRLTLSADGRPVEVRAERFGFDVAMFDMPADGSPVTVEILLASPFSNYTVKPSRHHIPVGREGDRLRLTLSRPLKLVLQVDSLPPVAILATPAETDAPAPGAPGVVYFGPGVTTAGVIRPLDGQTLYLAPGALVKGRIEAKNVRDVTVKGRGILETAGYSVRSAKTHGILFEHSRNILVEGIGVRSFDTWWQTLFLNSRDIVVSHLNIFGVGVNTDGVDIDGVRDFLVSDCFIRCEDDGLGWHALDAEANGEPITERATARDLVIWNTKAGNGIRIGASMETQLWRDILIERVDILTHAIAGIYSDFSDWAWCQDLVFRDIVIEKPSAPITFKIGRTGYSNGTGFLDERGHYERLVFENITMNGGQITLSGHGPAHRIDQVWFNHCVNAGAAVDTLGDIVINSHVTGVYFNQPVPPRPAPPPGRHEAESLESSTNTVPQITYADPQMSGGKGRYLKASAVGHHVDYAVEVPATGAFRATLRLKSTAGSGRFRVSVNGGASGDEHDLYSATAGPVSIDLGEVVVSTPGPQSFRLVVTGKNSASTGHRLDVDYIELKPALEGRRVDFFGPEPDAALAADQADPDHDGVPNLLEFALGRSPLVAETAAPCSLITDRERLALEFSRTAPPILDYAVQASDDLNTWGSIAGLSTGATAWSGPAEVSETGEGGLRVVRVFDPMPLAGSARRFLRLQAGVSETPLE